MHLSVGDGLPTLTMADHERGIDMTLKEFKVQVLVLALGQARLLAEMSCFEDKKIEPEQLRKNVAAILTVLIETEEFLNELPDAPTDSEI